MSQADGTFSLAGVPLYPGENALVVTVTDVSGNTSQQIRTVTKNNNALETFAYDNNGNLTHWISGTTDWVYEWDWADRLVKATSNNIVVLENWYDANSRRIAKKELVDGLTKNWLYLSDGWNIVGVMNESGSMLETFTRGVGLAGDIGTLAAVTHHTGGSATPGVYYAHHNHRGDIVLTRSVATTTGGYSYSAFGTSHSAFGDDVCRFQFSSKERDASTGFNYYGYRFYAPQWQRWVNRDPIGEEGGKNLYTFVWNDPNGHYDPDGRFAIPWPVIWPITRPAIIPIVRVILTGLGIGVGLGTSVCPNREPVPQFTTCHLDEGLSDHVTRCTYFCEHAGGGGGPGTHQRVDRKPGPNGCADTIIVPNPFSHEW